jgi:heme o synthase
MRPPSGGGGAPRLCLRAWRALAAAEAKAAAREGVVARGQQRGATTMITQPPAILSSLRAASHAAASTSGRLAGASSAATAWQLPPNQPTTKLQALARRWMASAAATTASPPSAGAAAIAAAEAAVAASARQPRVTGARALARDLKQLSKARLSLLVALTASTGYVLGDVAAEDNNVRDNDGTTTTTTTTTTPTAATKTRAEWWRGLAATTVGTWLAAASANALNQLYEVRNDAAMRRTCLRPLPAGRLAPGAAAAFALASGAAGIGLLWRETSATTAGLGAANILLYAGVYTPLKQVTVANTWVGAVVGAIPPLMGWAAAAAAGSAAAGAPSGSDSSAPSSSSSSSSSRWTLSAKELSHPGAWVLALGLFSWQMPHFMALAWLCREDYRAGGFKMLSTLAPPSAAVAAASPTLSPLLAARELVAGRRVAAVAVRHSLALLPIGLAAAWLGLAEPGWHSRALAAESGVLAVAMAAASAAFYARPDAATARRAFRASLAYLPLLMLGMVVHRKRNSSCVPAEVGATLLLEEEEEAEGPAAAPALRAPPSPPPPPPRTWGEVRDRLADAGWWWAPSPSPPSAVMSVRLRLRSPEERVASAVLARDAAEEEATGPPPAEAEAATDLISELRAALGLTHCPSRVYGEAVEGVAVEEEAGKEDHEQGKAEEEEHAGQRRRRWWWPSERPGRRSDEGET